MSNSVNCDVVYRDVIAVVIRLSMWVIIHVTIPAEANCCSRWME